MDVIRMLRKHGDIVAVLLLGLTIAWLQGRYLHEAALPITDEGSHAEAGRMLFEGYQLYTDFYYPHPPLLALLLGGGLKIFGSMYALRLLYLLLNVASFVPLYLVLRHFTRDRLASLIGIAFYATFHEMVHHDFRFIASRQLSNVLVIGFAYVTFLGQKWKFRSVAECVLATLTTLLLFPAVLNIALVCLAAIGMAKGKRERLQTLRHYALIGGGAALALIAFFLLVPQSMDKTLLEHLGLPAVDRWGRVLWVVNDRPLDLLLYGTASLSLLLGILLLPGRRILLLCMLCMIIAVFIPAEFWPHYLVTAGVAFAFGMAFLPPTLGNLIQERWRVAAYLLPCALLGIHLWGAVPSLLQEWNGNRDKQYYDIVAQLRELPEPVLTFMEPSFAIDADKRITQHYYRATRFTTTLHYRIPEQDLAALAKRSCSMFLTGWDRGLVPEPLLAEWKQTYELVREDPLMLITHNANCPEQ